MIVTPRQLTLRAELYHQLGAMISAGIPLIQALESTLSNPSIRVSREEVRKLLAQLKTGSTFTESLTHVRGWIPEFDKALLSVGETTGRLDVSLRQLAIYYAARAKVIRDTILGLFTTLATLHVFLIIFPLPLLTRMVQGILSGDFTAIAPFLLQKALVFGLCYGLVFLFIYASQGNRGETWRAILEQLLDRIPLFGKARRHLVLARLSAALEALVSGGVTIIESWQLASAASGSPALRRRVAQWRHDLDAGATPAELVRRSSYFPETFASLYHSGEVSGRLDEMLGRLRVYFEEDGFRRLATFARVMNGTIYGLVVLLVAYNVITFYVGRFNAMFEVLDP